MIDLLDLFRQNPWILVALLLGAAIWIASVWIVVRSRKFRRKWLWALLSLLSFSYGWSPQPGEFISIGFPLGAAYIIWFWRFGKPPSPEQIERARERLAAAPQPIAPAGRVRLLQASYIVAAIATLVVGWLAVSGLLMNLMLNQMKADGGSPPPEFQSFFSSIRYAQGLLCVALAGLFAWLSTRPYWWGKLLCLWAALAWSGFGLIELLFAGFSATLGWILAAAAAMVLATIVLQIADPRFGGSYLRVSPNTGTIP